MDASAVHPLTSLGFIVSLPFCLSQSLHKTQLNWEAEPGRAVLTARAGT